MKKRFMSMLLVLCMVFTLFPSAAFAAETGTPIGTTSVTEGTPLCENHKVHDTDCGYSCTHECELCKDVAPALLSATPRDIIGTGYSYDSGTTTLKIFNNAGTTEWRANSSFTTMQRDITTVDIQSNVTDIGADAFSGCTKLASVAIPISVTTVGTSAFKGCESLESVTFESTTPPSFGTDVFTDTLISLKIYVPTASAVITYKNVANLATWRDKIEAVDTITGFSYDPDTKTLIISSDTGTTAWRNSSDIAKEDVTTVVIEKGVTTIGDSAFLGCTSLASVTIPEGVTTIGDMAFSECTILANVTIPKDVTTIGAGAFFGCTNLASVTIPKSVTTIGANTFTLCTKLASVTIPESVTSIGGQAFANCTNLASVTFAEGSQLETIGTNAFSNCTILASVTIPERVTTIGASAFDGCKKLASVTIPESVTTIDTRVFSGCTSLASVTIPKDVTTIGESAFLGCTSLASVTIPESVTTIGYGAFGVCKSLASVTIPERVTTIGDYAFSDCTILTSVIFEGATPPTFGEDVFAYTTDTLKIYVPTADAVTDYKAVTNLASWQDRIEVVAGGAIVTAIAVTPKTASVQKGNTQQFNASVTGTNNPAQTVTWAVTGGAKSGTTINASGLLTVAADETATSLTVKATSTVDNTKSDTATVAVTAAPATVTTVAVTPKTASVQQGNTQQFNAAVTGTNNPAQTVTWAVTGGAKSGTTINASGLLTVAADETATSLTVKATSTVDNTKSDTATVAVTEAPHTHNYNETIWKTDAASHWHECIVPGCTVLQKDLASHIPGEWIVDKAATVAETGKKHTECTVCKTVTAQETIPAIPKTVRTFTAGIYNYAVTSADGAKTATVELKSFARGKSASKVTVKKTVTYQGKTYNITGIADKAFYKNKNLREINISNAVTYIGKKAFYECTKLTNVILGNKVSKIEDHAFYKCTGLKKVTIGTGLKTIGEYVFYHDKKLTSLTIKSTKLTKVGKHNLYKCRNLKIKVPSSKVKAYTKFFKNQGQSSNVKVTK